MNKLSNIDICNIYIYGFHACVVKTTLRSCISLFAPFFNRATVASTLFTAAAQCRADLPKRDTRQEGKHILSLLKYSHEFKESYLER